jgi:hypothetical protein
MTSGKPMFKNTIKNSMLINKDIDVMPAPVDAIVDLKDIGMSDLKHK